MNAGGQRCESWLLRVFCGTALLGQALAGQRPAAEHTDPGPPGLDHSQDPEVEGNADAR